MTIMHHLGHATFDISFKERIMLFFFTLPLITAHPEMPFQSPPGREQALPVGIPLFRQDWHHVGDH